MLKVCTPILSGMVVIWHRRRWMYANGPVMMRTWENADMIGRRSSREAGSGFLGKPTFVTHSQKISASRPPYLNAQ